MTRDEIVAELKLCERRIHKLNVAYQWEGAPRPSVADPAVCARREELRRMLVERAYK